MEILRIPVPSLVLLMGASGAGKSTFAKKHFKVTEVVSSDKCRAMVCDDENDQSASGDAFELVHMILEKRLARGRLTVVDATNVQPGTRRSLRAMAARHRLPVGAIVLDLPEKVCVAHNRERAGRVVPVIVIRRQIRDLKASLAKLSREDLAFIHVLESPAAVNAAKIRRVR